MYFDDQYSNNVYDWFKNWHLIRFALTNRSGLDDSNYISIDNNCIAIKTILCTFCMSVIYIFEFLISMMNKLSQFFSENLHVCYPCTHPVWSKQNQYSSAHHITQFHEYPFAQLSCYSSHLINTNTIHPFISYYALRYIVEKRKKGYCYKAMKHWLIVLCMWYISCTNLVMHSIPVCR